MLDLSSILPRKVEKWYEFRLFQHKNMNHHERENHLSSMKYSQGVEYGNQLRLVLDERDEPGLDPWNPLAYRVHGVSSALRVVEQLVINHQGETRVYDVKDGKVTGLIAGGLGRSAEPEIPVANEPLSAGVTLGEGRRKLAF